MRLIYGVVPVGDMHAVTVLQEDGAPWIEVDRFKYREHAVLEADRLTKLSALAPHVSLVRLMQEVTL